MEKCSQVKYSEKDFPSSPTGVEPMTFQKYRLDALTTELWGTHGERGHILGSYVTHVLPYHPARLKYVEMINVDK